MDILEWKTLLHVKEEPPLSISTKLDLPNQRVITSDVDRTRTGILTADEKRQLELLLTYYCKEFNTSYKQGMNEIVAPFFLMTRQGVSLQMTYLLFKSFLHKFLPTMFADKHFKPLQAMFLIFKLILRYFDPRLSAFFVLNNIEPQLFVTPWLLTLFSGKINNMQALYMLWKEVIIENDVIFPLFISISIILYYKDKLVSCTDKIVPQFISQIFFDDIHELREIITKARERKNTLPYSILIKLSKSEIFNLENIDDLISSLEKEACLSVLPCEVIHRAYPEVDVCPCDSATCPWKTGRGRNVPLVIIDCRTHSEQEAGIFPNSILLDSQAYTDTDFMLNFPDQFIPMRNLYHFCLMGRTQYKGSGFHLGEIGEHQNSEVQNMLENLIQAFLIKGFNYISVLEGGFEECHAFAEKFNIEVDNHDRNNCRACLRGLRRERNGSFELRLSTKIDNFKSKECIASESSPTLKELVTTGKSEAQPEIKSDKFIFLCEKYENGEKSNEEYMINVSKVWFSVSIVNLELVQEIFRFRISGLVKLTFIKKNPRVLSFRFSEHIEDLFFLMRSIEEAKQCVNQISKYFQKSLENSE